MIAFRQLDWASIFCCYLIDGSLGSLLEVTTADRVLRLRDIAIDVFEPVTGTDFGDMAQRDFLTARIDASDYGYPPMARLSSESLYHRGSNVLPCHRLAVTSPQRAYTTPAAADAAVLPSARASCGGEAAGRS